MITFMLNTKKVFQKRSNEKDWPKDYICNFLEAGVVSYEDVGAGVALLKKETIDRMLSSIVGKPVLIDHKDVTPTDFKKEAVGYVTEAYFNPGTGWFDCKFILTDDKAKKVVEQGYSVSCSFDVLSTAQGGEWHAVKYDEEITGGTFTHLALVTTPRYEECRIFANSKAATILNEKAKCSHCGKEVPEGKGIQDGNKTYCCESCKVKHEGRNEKDVNNKGEVKMFGLGKKKDSKAGPDVDPKDPTKQKWAAKESFVTIGNEKVSVETLLNSVETADNASEGTEVSVEDTIMYNDKEYKVSDLVKLYQDKKEKKNEDKEEDPEEKKKKDDDKKKADDDKKKADDDKKKDDDKKADDDKKKDDKKEEDDPEKKKDDDKKKKDDAEEAEEKGTVKKNDVKHFQKLNALKNSQAEETVATVDMIHNKVERGQDRYGSKKVAKE